MQVTFLDDYYIFVSKSNTPEIRYLLHCIALYKHVSFNLLKLDQLQLGVLYLFNYLMQRKRAFLIS